MFKNTFQSGFLSVLYSIGSKPLQLWDKTVRNGHIKRITDNDIQSLVLEIIGTNVSTTYITCPADPKKTIGIKLPYLVMIVKNMKKYFTFEVQVWFYTFVCWLDGSDFFVFLLRCRFLMTRMWGADSVQAITSRQPEWSLSYAQCRWGWMKGGIRSSSTWQILQGGLTGQTMLRRWGSRSTPTAGSAAFTFPTGCIQKMSCLLSSNSTFLFRRKLKSDHLSHILQNECTTQLRRAQYNYIKE